MDHASHFGGIAVGIAVAAYLRYSGFERPATMPLQTKENVQARRVDVGATPREVTEEVKRIAK